MSNIREVKFDQSKVEVQQEIVEILERWLVEAKEGRIAAIALAAARPAGEQVTEYNSGVNASLTLQSAVTTLFLRIGTRIAGQ